MTSAPEVCVVGPCLGDQVGAFFMLGKLYADTA
jgi:hypothetical protein